MTLLPSEISNLKEQIADALFEIGAIKFGAFKLKLHETHPSDPLSPIYLNLRTPENPTPGPLTPYLTDCIGQLFANLAKEHSYDLVAGVPRAGDPFASAFLKALPPQLKVGRLHLEKKEELGKRHVVGIIGGSYKAGNSVLLIDDLITGADSKLEAIDVLKKAGLEVKDILVLVDREQGGVTQLQRLGCSVFAAYTLSELLAYYVETRRIQSTTRDNVLEYLKGFE